MKGIQQDFRSRRKNNSIYRQVATEIADEFYTDRLFCTMLMVFSRNRMRVDNLYSINDMRMRRQADTSYVPDKDKRQKRRLKI
jgi:hypothetical protein